MVISISDHFTYSKLIRFVIPSICMMVFTSIYTVVDGFFVSNYTGNIPFASVNLILPFLLLISAIGFMIGTGGTALVSLKLGEQNKKHANKIFSMLVYLILTFGIVMSILMQFILKDVALLLGATKEMLPYAMEYGRIYLIGTAAFMLQTLFQSFLVAASKPKFGLYITLIAGFTNMILDYVLVGVLKMGVSGAALATIASQFVGGIVPLIYFILPNSSELRLCKTTLDLRSLLITCGNGFSEFLSNISINIVAMIYNLQLLKYIGESGVTAYGVIMYVCFIFIAVFLGYSIGVSPLISYHYGAKNIKEVNNIYRKCLIIIGALSLTMLVSSELLASPLAKLYVGYDANLFTLTKSAFKIYAVSFVLMGYNMFASAYFTALNNGKISAILSMLRTLVFQILCVLILPLIFGINGIWIATSISEALSLLISVFFLKKYNLSNN